MTDIGTGSQAGKRKNGARLEGRSGQMAEYMRVSGMKISRLGMASAPGSMEASILETGKMDR